MNTCTFFGHKNTPDSAAPALKKAIINLIEQEDVACFYVGSQGKFDMMTIRILKEIKHLYPHVAFAIVLSKLPSQKEKSEWDFSDTVFPEGLEKTPPRFAINKRNEWMLKNSDYVVCYVAHITGGAAKFTEKAKKKGKQVINLAELI